MNGYLVYDNNFNIVARFQGGNQTEKDIIEVNNFKGMECIKVDIKDPYKIEDYNIDNDGNVVLNKKSDKDLIKLKANVIIKENKELINYFINEINSLRSLLSLPDIGLSNAIKYIYENEIKKH